MNKVLCRLGLAVAILAATAAVALAAATPKLGGVYVGKTSHNHRVEIDVARHPLRNGNIPAVLKLCGFKAHITIVHGHFGVNLTTAGGLVHIFRAKGSWGTSRLMHGQIDLDFASGCQGLPGPFSASLR